MTDGPQVDLLSRGAVPPMERYLRKVALRCGVDEVCRALPYARRSERRHRYNTETGSIIVITFGGRHTVVTKGGAQLQLGGRVVAVLL